MPFTARVHLRAETSAAHARLDAEVAKLSLDQRAGYERFLTAQAAALLPLEERLAAENIAELLPDWAERSRGAPLRADLKTLGLSVKPLRVVRFGNPAALMGAVYMLEGLRLGAQPLLARVEETGDDALLKATLYLRHGVASHLWTSFREALEKTPEVRAEPAAAVAGALAAFALFERGFAPLALTPAD